MARGVGGGIPGNGLGQGFTSPSTFTHVLCVSGAPIGAVGGAADGRRSMQKTSFGTAISVPHAVLRGGRTHNHPMSAAAAKNRVVNAHGGPKRRPVVKMNVLSRLCPVPKWN